MEKQTYCSHCFEVAIAPVACDGCDDSVCKACVSDCFRAAPKKAAPKKRTRKTQAPKAESKPAAELIAIRERNDWSLAGVLLAAAVIVRTLGYRKTSEERSTKSAVILAIRDSFRYEPCDLDAVEDARGWYADDILKSDSDFATKLRDACERARSQGEVATRDLGFIVSMIPCAARWAERQNQPKIDPQNVVFAGVAGQSGRQDIGPITVETVREMSQYDSWLVKARVQSGPWQGARVSWFSKDQLSEGFQAELRAKVKSHSEQYGETQVSLVRLG